MVVSLVNAAFSLARITTQVNGFILEKNLLIVPGVSFTVQGIDVVVEEEDVDVVVIVVEVVVNCVVVEVVIPVVVVEMLVVVDVSCVVEVDATVVVG